MVTGFFEIVAILIGGAFALRVIGNLATVIAHARLKDPAVIHAQFQRERFRELMESGGPRTRIVSFEVRTNPPRESSAS